MRRTCAISAISAIFVVLFLIANVSMCICEMKGELTHLAHRSQIEAQMYVSRFKLRFVVVGGEYLKGSAKGRPAVVQFYICHACECTISYSLIHRGNVVEMDRILGSVLCCVVLLGCCTTYSLHGH